MRRTIRLFEQAMTITELNLEYSGWFTHMPTGDLKPDDSAMLSLHEEAMRNMLDFDFVLEQCNQPDVRCQCDTSGLVRYGDLSEDDQEVVQTRWYEDDFKYEEWLDWYVGDPKYHWQKRRSIMVNVEYAWTPVVSLANRTGITLFEIASIKHIDNTDMVAVGLEGRVNAERVLDNLPEHIYVSKLARMAIIAGYRSYEDGFSFSPSEYAREYHNGVRVPDVEFNEQMIDLVYDAIIESLDNFRGIVNDKTWREIHNFSDYLHTLVSDLYAVASDMLTKSYRINVHDFDAWLTANRPLFDPNELTVEDYCFCEGRSAYDGRWQRDTRTQNLLRARVRV